MKNKTLTVVIPILLVCSLGLNIFLIFGQKSDSKDEKNQVVYRYIGICVDDADEWLRCFDFFWDK